MNDIKQHNINIDVTIDVSAVLRKLEVRGVGAGRGGAYATAW